MNKLLEQKGINFVENFFLLYLLSKLCLINHLDLSD